MDVFISVVMFFFTRLKILLTKNHFTEVRLSPLWAAPGALNASCVLEIRVENPCKIADLSKKKVIPK